MSSDLRSLSPPPAHPLQLSVLQAFPAVEQFISMQGPSLLCREYLISLKRFWLTVFESEIICIIIMLLLLTSSKTYFELLDLHLAGFFSCDHHFGNKLVKCFWLVYNDT